MDALIELILAIPFAILESVFNELWSRTGHLPRKVWRIPAKVGLVVVLLMIAVILVVGACFLLGCLARAVGCEPDWM